MSALYYHQIVVYILALLPSSLTQLTGSITTTDNRFVITISISNPTYNTISILKWNNVFDDQLDLPVSFTVKDDEGNEAPFATTYAMRSGISNNDLYVLKPGQTFSRIYDIRQFLQSIPSVKHGLYTKTIQIIPPATFQGVMSNGPYNVPAEAAADLSSGTLGNFAAARLIDIRLQAKVLLTAHNFPIYQNPDPGDSIPADGVQLDTASCMGQNATDLSSTIFDAGVYAKSLVSAAEDFSSVLFPQFFQSSQRLHVKAAGNLAANALQGNGFHVDAYCSDIQNLCDAKGSVLGNNYYGVQSCQQLVKRTPVDVTSNADSYAQLAIAQWGFGLGGAPYRGPSCLPANGLVPANERRDVQTMQDAKFLAETIASRSLSRRQFPNYTPEEAVRDAQDCAGDQLTLIQNAATNARALASAARGSQNNDLWTQTFNGDTSIKREVNRIFDAIANWNTTGNSAGINFKCDPRRKTLTCKFGTESALIGFPNRKLAYMIFCPRFFYQPAALECEAPSTANPYIQDQAGTLLHELIHVRWLVNRDIGDGYSASGEGGECYGWPCVTSYAQNRNLPGFDPRNLPENVASNYEYYAFAVRAAYTDCSWTTYAGSMFGIGTLIN